MPTSKQDKEFSELMASDVYTITISNVALDNAIEWIVGNLDPADVFSDKELAAWAESNGYTKE